MDVKLSQKQNPKDSVRRRRYSESFRENVAGYLFIAPWLVGFLLLTIWPILQSFYLSFTDYTLLAPPNWVGLANYKNLLTNDDVFYTSLGVTVRFVLFAVPLKLAFSLFVAMLLNRPIKGMSFYRTAIYFPSLIGGSVAVAALWRNMFGMTGYVNKILEIFHIPTSAWIADPNTALGTLILLNVWQFGSTMIIFLSGLKQIPRELYEAASIDGAGKVRTFFNVTLPLLSPVLFFNLILGIIGSFQMFNSAFIITQGGPANATYMYALFLYEQAFKSFKMGYAATLAWILLAIIGLLTALNFFLSKYWVFYQNDDGGKRK